MQYDYQTFSQLILRIREPQTTDPEYLKSAESEHLIASKFDQ
jgi:hypothetical protein